MVAQVFNLCTRTGKKPVPPKTFRNKENPVTYPDLYFPLVRTGQKNEKKLDSRGDW
jgi:hypothetical protein